MTVLTAMPSSLRLSTPERDFWVADDAGRFAGTIDRQGSSFFVRNGFAEYLGGYRSLEDAERALRAHLDEERSTWG